MPQRSQPEPDLKLNQLVFVQCTNGAEVEGLAGPKAGICPECGGERYLVSLPGDQRATICRGVIRVPVLN